MKGDMQPGPRFTDLMAKETPDQAAPPFADAGMSMSPPQTPNMQAALQANLTNPVHAARQAADLSKRRLMTMAQQIREARDAL